MATNIIESANLGFQLKVQSPFITCFHHKDLFPKGNAQLEPTHYLVDRIPGSDFRESAPWRMYHGDKFPGFPVHPHRGFETVTLVTNGWVDHSDGLKCGGRYGNGDAQWMTAGSGLQHSEMFPLLNTEQENPMELFQIWLNLPAKSKFVNPYYKMLWNEFIPLVNVPDQNKINTQLRIVSGSYKNTSFYQANPDSWAFDPANLVNIWIIRIDPLGTFTLPKTESSVNRSIYFYGGTSLHVDELEFSNHSYAFLKSDTEIIFKNNETPAEILLLEGNPIQEPVAAYGPFIMNTYDEIQQAYRDYQETQFGGWPWDSQEPVHPVGQGRFASYPDGTIEVPVAQK